MARFAVRNELGRYIVIVSRLICHFLWLLNVERLTILKISGSVFFSITEA